jgi:hypothetical protein
MTLVFLLHVPVDAPIEFLSFIIFFASILFGVIPSWMRWRRHGEHAAARSWPVAIATIDVVSVSEVLVESHGSSETTGFKATLTYFYRNPELQIGEYERFFPLASVARAWVGQFKGRQASVHVNPQRPGESVLLDADIEALATLPVLSPEEAIRRETASELPVVLRLLAVITEVICVAGVATSALLFWNSLTHAGAAAPVWLLWTGGGGLAFAAASSFVLTLRFVEGSNQSFLRSYSLWCPPWVRWSLNGLGVFGFLLGTVINLREVLPKPVEEVFRTMIPHAMYVLVCWAFLSMAAFHWAILQSQRRGACGRAIAGERAG